MKPGGKEQHRSRAMGAGSDRLWSPADARRPIGVFDSGIGGLTVVRALRKRLPGEDIIYFGDSARVPYGTKSPSTVVRFSRESLTFLLRRGVKMLIVACNTASAIALPRLASSLPVPVLGVLEPGSKAAVRASRRRRIGVIATEATIASGSYRERIGELDPEAEVFEKACPLFVPLAEEGWLEGEVPALVARHYLQPLVQAGVDALVLGCTHYPLLAPVIAGVVGPGVQLIDSGEETAKEAEGLLEEQGTRNPREGGGGCRVFVSDRPRRFEQIGQAFLGEPLGEVTVVDQSEVPWYEREPASFASRSSEGTV